MKKALEDINKEYPRRNGYYYIGDKSYISVTTVLNAINKPALVTWACRKGIETALADPSLDMSEAYSLAMARKKEKADIGSEIHKLIEGISRGTFDAKTIGNMPEETMGYMKAFMSWLQSNNPKLLHSEKIIYSDKYQYAGTLDAIWNISGMIYLVDVKTSKDIYKEVGLQLIAYKTAVLEMGLIDRIDKMACLLLKPDGNMRFEEVEADIEVFLATKKLWEFLNEGGK